jgi:hypothetical protein
MNPKIRAYYFRLYYLSCDHYYKIDQKKSYAELQISRSEGKYAPRYEDASYTKHGQKINERTNE